MISFVNADKHSEGRAFDRVFKMSGQVTRMIPANPITLTFELLNSITQQDEYCGCDRITGMEQLESSSTPCEVGHDSSSEVRIYVYYRKCGNSCNESRINDNVFALEFDYKSKLPWSKEDVYVR